MTRLSDISLRLEPASAPGSPRSEDAGLGRGGYAILVKLAALLDQLVDSNIAGAIDLQNTPISEKDRVRLQKNLGRGEVRAFLDAEGMFEVQETAIPGIWWIQHRDKDGALIAELLEVAAVPEILARAQDEITSGVDLLRQRIARSVPTRVIAPQYGR